jgi:hypothetical protein
MHQILICLVCMYIYFCLLDIEFWAGGVARVVERLPSKCEALSVLPKNACSLDTEFLCYGGPIYLIFWHYWS